uniref:Poly(rC) binding protein 4 n=1 Tax=Fundulus heteroclitus TaxID=8078 RepID=A0A3Q2NS35_FUNHE
KMACPCIALYQSCARVNISEGSCPERIITITGSTESVFRAFTMITYKLEEVGATNSSPLKCTYMTKNILGICDEHAILLLMVSFHVGRKVYCYQMQPNHSERSQQPVHKWPYLLNQANLIYILYHLQSTGAQIQVAGDLLPNSTERGVTISGNQDSVIQCVKLICTVIVESPPKGATIPYRPRVDCTCLPTKGAECMCKSFDASALFSEYLCSLSSGMDTNSQTSQELLIPNDLIGSIIGRQGTKINEIRQVSGAQIKIGSQLDGTSDRHVTITGTPVSINLAQYLITSCLETAKSTAQAATMGSPVDLNMAFTQPTSPTASPAPTLATMGTLTPAHMLGTPYGAMPLSGLLGMKSVPFLTLSSPAPTVAATAAPSHATLAAYTAKISSANCIKKPERQKFAPY